VPDFIFSKAVWSSDTSDSEWDTLKRAISESADKTIAVKTQAKRKPWIKPEMFEMTEKKREYKRDIEDVCIVEVNVQHDTV